MDLQKLEAELAELEKRFRERNAADWKFLAEIERQVGYKGSLNEERQRKLEAFEAQQNAVYHLRNSIRPVLDAVIAAYPEMRVDERATVRELFHKMDCGAYGLHYYIYECVECLETPDDADAFRLALIALSIQNCAQDFRDTGAILAELGVSAFQAGIEMESHCNAIAELSSEQPSTGGCAAMKTILADFPRYAPTAKRVW